MNDIMCLVKKFIDDKQSVEWRPGIDTITYSSPYFDANEYQAAIASLLDGWLVMGKKAQQFERVFCKQFDREYGVLTNSGSSSNLIMMNALKSKRGYNLPAKTKVLTPVAGFPTTINPIFQVAFEPVFIDIELDTLNLDLTQAEQLIKEHDIKVITFAHALGNPPNMDKVMYLVNAYKLILLEDCCDALGSTYNDKKVGSFGDFASCSFYPAHHITMGEGGYIACKDKQSEDIIRSFREWGRGCYCVGPEANKLKCGTCKKRFSNWIDALPEEIFDHKFIYDEIGYNMKPLEMQAAIGLEQLKKLSKIHELRTKNFNRLYSIYSKYQEYFKLPVIHQSSKPSWFAFPLTIKSSAPFKRRQYIDYLEENKIQTRTFMAGNILLQPAYNHLIASSDAISKYKNATYAMTNTFFHGVSPSITDIQLDYIEEIINKFMIKHK